MKKMKTNSCSGQSGKAKACGIFIIELITASASSLFICIILTGVLLVLGYTNVLGYFNPGGSFHPFPSHQDSDFQEALQYIQNTPLADQPTLEKWSTPIMLRYEGSYTEKDIDALKKIIECFNSVKGFPGINLVEKDENVLLTYVSTNEQFEQYKNKYSKDEGTASFCSQQFQNGSIYEAGIVIFCDGFQGYRNSTVLHEFTHLIGFYNHTDSRQSILNKSGPVAGMSSTDLLAFQMYYNPEITPGATAETLKEYYSKADIADYQYVTGSEETYTYPLALEITGGLAAFVVLIAFFPLRKNIKPFRQTAKLLAALAICLLFFQYVEKWMPSEALRLISF